MERHYRVPMIMQVCEDCYGLVRGSIVDRDRSETISECRHLAAYLSRMLTRHSYSEIANFFHRDHTTIIHSCKKVIMIVEKDEYVRGLLKELINKIEAA